VAEDEDSDIEILPAQGTVAFLNYRLKKQGCVRIWNFFWLSLSMDAMI
jgi:hypothetical protein